MNIVTHHQNRMRVLIAAVVPALAVLGWTSALAGPSDIELEIMQSSKLSLADAITTAERETGGQVIEAELDEDDDMFFYKLEVLRDDDLVLVYINPASGVVVGTREPGLVRGASRGSAQQSAEAVRGAKVSLSQALGIAEQRTGGRAVEIELEREGAGYIYEVTTIQPGLEHDLEIDIQSGSILDVDEDD